jgi:colicin import membrane protein
MTAITAQGFASEHRNGLVVAVVGHLLLLAALSTSLVLLPRVPATRLAIEAVIVDASAIKRATEADRRKTEQAAQRRREESALQQRQEKERKAADQRRKQEQTEAERQRQVQQRKQAEERAAAEQQRKQAEATAAAEAKARAEQQRIEAEARAAAEAERREQQRRQAELIATMEAEEALLAARDSGELAEYLALIQQQVTRNWVRPASARNDLQCEVVVKQLPGGDVTSANVVSCNGDEVVRRSVENAVMKSSPLPMPANRALFERNLRFIFKPEQ